MCGVWKCACSRERVDSNRVGCTPTPPPQDGAVALANGIASNKTLREMNLMNMLMLGKSERVLRAFIDMYETNITLKKIIWRLDHPLANTLARLMTRNNTIDRRIKQGKSYAELLPDKLRGTAEATAATTPIPEEAEDKPAPAQPTEPEVKQEEAPPVEQPPAPEPEAVEEAPKEEAQAPPEEPKPEEEPVPTPEETAPAQEETAPAQEETAATEE